MMDPEYRLHCKNFGEPEYLVATAVPYIHEPAPRKQRYFYAERGGKRVCFIKLQNEETPVEQTRAKIERQSGYISSPYVVAHIPPDVMCPLKVEWRDQGEWKLLSDKILLLEYLPMDLEQFWGERIGTVSESRLAHDRGHILLKLLEGVGHLYRSHLVHRDIKPKNIMINCAGLCDGAEWAFDELDVKLTDFDSAHDGYIQGAAFFTGTKPFQPEWPCQPNSWLDLYSVCMVALWLYNEDHSLLCQLSRQPCQSEQEICEILRTRVAIYPDGFLACIVPAIYLSTQGILPQGTQRSFVGVLSELADGLHRCYFGSQAQRPMELLEPCRNQVDWSAVLQIDQDYWPVFGRGREYYTLSMADCTGKHDVLENVPDLTDSFSSTEYMLGKTKFGQYMLSGPPEICIAYMDQGGARHLSVRMFGTVQQAGGREFQPQCLMGWEDILPGADTVLYNEEACIQTWQERESLFHKIRIHCVNFYKCALPAPWPPFRGSIKVNVSNINILLVMGVSKAQKEDDLSCRLLHQLVEQISTLEECCPCYYGMTMLHEETRLRFMPFCTGERKIGEKSLINSFRRTSTGRMIRDKYSWEQTGQNVCAFSPERPTVMICYLDQAATPEQIDQLKQELEKMSRDFRYAVDYLQVFLPFQSSKNQKAWERTWEPMLPQLASLVRPDGTFVVTPLNTEEKLENSVGQRPADADARWLTVIRAQCQQTAYERVGGRNVIR